VWLKRRSASVMVTPLGKGGMTRARLFVDIVVLRAKWVLGQSTGSTALQDTANSLREIISFPVQRLRCGEQYRRMNLDSARLIPRYCCHAQVPVPAACPPQIAVPVGNDSPNRVVTRRDVPYSGECCNDHSTACWQWTWASMRRSMIMPECSSCSRGSGDRGAPTK
jgi:hypothetical protein